MPWRNMDLPGLQEDALGERTFRWGWGCRALEESMETKENDVLPTFLIIQAKIPDGTTWGGLYFGFQFQGTQSLIAGKACWLERSGEWWECVGETLTFWWIREQSAPAKGLSVTGSTSASHAFCPKVPQPSKVVLLSWDQVFKQLSCGGRFTPKP